ncbi:uncharacterized protein LOC141596654 [Silene latifolia]|uniref:uncharacterized protein LOC141596654 n=1 Tax=Silene latifolia TaxID=37657 RepID=UPI003D77707D
METQQQQQQQYEYQQYQNQAQTDPNQTTQPYDPSQIQAYDPSSYYATYPQHYDTTTQQQYQQQTYQTNPDSSATTYTASSYFYPDYYDPNSIHPPGVPVSADTQQIPPPISDYCYQPPQTQPYFQPGQPVYGAVSSQGGRSSRRDGRGSFGRGKGRGGGRGKNSTQTTNTADASYMQEQAAASKPAPQMAWCELCRVDCTTPEVLKKHKNGKRHLRNLKVFEEMQNLSQQHLTVQNQAEGIAEAQTSDMADKTVQPFEEAVIQDFSGGRGGLKRKMRGGHGGAKSFRTPDGIRRLVDPPKPKPMFPFFCELCSVKCESQVIYESHLAGKKHLSSVKRYEGHKVVLGEAVESLYPTIPNLPPTIISQANQQVQGPQGAQTLASMMLSNQNLPDPEAAQAALAQLLTEHGVHDTQTLLIQLIPYLLTQPQEPLPEAGLQTNATSLQSQGPHVLSEVAGQSFGQNGEVTAEQQNLSGNV